MRYDFVQILLFFICTRCCEMNRYIKRSNAKVRERRLVFASILCPEYVLICMRNTTSYFCEQNFECQLQ